MRDALNRIMQSPEDYIMVASQPLQSFPCLGALDAAVMLIARNDSDTGTSRRRSALGWAPAWSASLVFWRHDVTRDVVDFVLANFFYILA